MRKLSQFCLVFFLVFSTINFAKSANVNKSILNLTKEKEKEFDSLPPRVQKLIVQDEVLRRKIKKIKKLSLNKSSKFSINNLMTKNNEEDRFRCVPNCTWRSNSDGSCNRYGQDYCAYEANCALNCTWRSNSDGTCNSYGADYCGERANCAKNCSWRSNSDGSCNSYDPDYCGYDAYCAVNCTWRSADGSCNSYGPDLCY